MVLRIGWGMGMGSGSTRKPAGDMLSIGGFNAAAT